MKARKITLLIMFALLNVGFLTAQTTEVQIIHNSADQAADTVDVYLDGTRILDDFAFRNATSFLEVPAETGLNIGVAGQSSTSVDDTIFNANVTFAQGQDYIVVANGIVSGSGYSPMEPFGFDVFSMARQEAQGTDTTDVLVYHGSTDAPTVDIMEPNAQLQLVDNISYGEFSADYLELPTADYSLQIQGENGYTPVAQYAASLNTLDLVDSALVVLASGFYDPSQNSDGPEIGLYVVLPSGGELIKLPEENISQARVQVIHNSADLAADTVDIYLNDGILLDDFPFRTASPFVNLNAGVNFDISVQPSNSTDTTGALAKYTYNLPADSKYLLVASGIISGSGYSPAEPFDIYVKSMAREKASSSGNTDVMVFHGSTDAPGVDVMEPNAQLQLVDDLQYGNFLNDYLELTTANYSLQVQNETGYSAVAQYSAPLDDLGLTDSALVIVASGFLDSTQNSDGPAFGLYVALPSGGDLVKLPAEDLSKAMVQVIHNSADAAASSVDIYKNDAILLDDFEFLNASPFVELTAGINFDIAVQPSSSTDTSGSLAKFTYNLKSGEKYELIASGLVSTSGYDPLKPFDIKVFEGARKKAVTSGETDVLVYHGSTDAPVVDIYESSGPAGTLVDDLAYGEYSSDYLELSTANYILDIQDETGTTTVQRFNASLDSLGLTDSAIVVVAAGFLTPEDNNNGTGFGLYAALPSGGDLVKLSVYEEEQTGIEDGIFAGTDFRVYPNPVTNQLNIELMDIPVQNIKVELFDVLGKKVTEFTKLRKPGNVKTLSYDITSLKEGIYFLSITDGKERITKKIQVVK